MAGACGCAASALRRHRAVTISTEPAGTARSLTGGAEPVAELAATPAVLRLPQAPRDLCVFCTLPGRAPVAAVLPVVVDAGEAAVAAALGGAHRYPSKLDITLPPMRFATAAERDRFFAGRAAESRRHFDQPIQANRSMCRPDEFGCGHMIAEMERAMDEELTRLEGLREATPPAY